MIGLLCYVLLDAAFESLVQARTGALLVGNDAFLNSWIEQIVALAVHHAIPVMYSLPQFIVDGGLKSYGASPTEYRQIGPYAGRILKDTRPADLPLEQSSKFELVINVESARLLGLTVPPTLLSIADEVIE